MKTLIYGAGSIGCFLGGHLAKAGHQVVLLGRQRLADGVAQHGLILQHVDGTQDVLRDITVETTFAEAWQHGPFDWIAFTMKANDTTAALMDIQQTLGFDASVPPIVSFQNGVGNERSIEAAFGDPDLIVAATVTTPVSMQAPHHVVEEKQRGIAIAIDSTHSVDVVDAFRVTDLEVQYVDEAESLLWSKLILNMVANATCAILDMTPAEVYANRELVALEQEALREALAIMDLADIEVVSLPGAPPQMLAFAARLPVWLFQLVMRSRVARGRGDKLPSLLLDLQAEKESTEIPWLNGAVAQKADEIERLVPINHTLALIVSDIVTGRTPWSMYQRNPDMLLMTVRAAKGMGR